jgi:hypothetical protein
MRIPLRVHEFLRRPAFRLNAAAGRYRPVVWLIGEGRSGTTWVASLINADGSWREMFEPVHPLFVPAFRDLPLHAYRHPAEEDPALEAAMRAVLGGRISHWRIDIANRRFLYRGLIVKDIFSSLIAAWTLARVEGVNPVLLIRNPFAVAASKQQKMIRDRYRWADRTALLTGQPRLMADHLGPFEPLLRQVDAEGDFIERQIALWAAIHHVLFRQFRPGSIHVMFYEHVAADPAAAMRRLGAVIDAGRVFAPPDPARIGRASLVSSEADLAARRDAGPLAWRRGLDDAAVARGRAVLEAFGLGGLYDGAGQPVPGWLARFPIGGASPGGPGPVTGEAAC